MNKLIPVILFAAITFSSSAQQEDSLDNDRISKMVSLSEVVMRSDINVAKFIERVKNDTTFYKAFRTLHIIDFTSLNDIRLLDKKGSLKASLHSKTKQKVAAGCRTMEILEENTTGNFYDDNKNYNYYTAELYAGLFFTKDKICGENNIVKGIELSPRNKSGIEKHKEQLKMLFFNPGKKVPGIPFIGDKLDLYDEHAHKLYDYQLHFIDYKGSFAYVFSIKPKDDLGLFQRGDIVVDEMTTRFDATTMEVVGRTYSLSYKAGLYDFAVSIEVEMTHAGKLLVPETMRYKGNFSAITKKRERGEFTATLFDFK